jgi:integrase/recombinase XerD
LKISEALGSFFAHHLRRKSDGTREWYAGRLGVPGERLREGCLLDWFGGERDIRSVTLAELNDWFTALSERRYRWRDHPFTPEANVGLSSATLHGYGRAVKTFWRFCGRSQIVTSDPTAFLELPPLPELPPVEVTDNEIRLLIRSREQHAESKLIYRRDLAIIRFLAFTGVRVGGLAGLRMHDLNLRQRWAQVREKGRGGQQKARFVVFDSGTSAIVRDYLVLSQRQSATDYVFLSDDRRPLTTAGVRCMLRSASEKAGLDRVVTPHMFRHRFAMEVLRRGGDVKFAQEFLGHEDVKTTMVYLRFRPETLRVEYDKLFGDRRDVWE